ncbi:MAG: hypothetical protein EOQ44_25395 [Mesorhizobium sp.]|uniref:hypothetical protein n=1 Tax=Mesorhizobium sp. TaxID=1871066 RepID=UPI000FE71B32|nr:hypothetical protein [Mesorhizobium sp.]RWB40476.1 MAG: hypothetical protein EOQ44_25395 [Mesorhizobium sp.]
MTDMRNLIQCIDHGVYNVRPDDCPLCPCCDQPLWAGERITLQTVDAGPGHPDLLRLVHTGCVDDEDDSDDEED